MIQSARSVKEKICIQSNGNWEGLYNKEDIIKDSSTCTSITDNCCHISIKYTYDLLPISTSYCYSMSGKISDWLSKFKNFYTDELMWYSNFTNDNYEAYTYIGNNLNYVYYSNKTCIEMHPREDYSDYDIFRCALFNDDGTCKILNDENYFNKYVENFYKNITASVCFNTNPITGECIEYLKDPNRNDKALEPLLEVLKKKLQIDEINLEVKENNTKNKINWPGPCRPVPLVSIKITCPETYIADVFVAISTKYIFMCIFLIFIILI